MKKVLLVLLSMLAISSYFAFPVFAQEENVIFKKNEVVTRDYFGRGERVQVSGTVNGDAYVAGGVVIVDGTINGDLLTAGGNVTISGNITGDVRAGGGNVTFTGATVGGNITVAGGNITIDKATTINGSLVSAGGNIQIFAPVGKGITLGGGTVLLANTVGGDVKAGVGDLSLAPQAAISGNLTYWSDSKVTISDGATISGVTEHKKAPQADTKKMEDAGKAIGAAISGIFLGLKLLDLLWLLLAGFIFIKFLPNFSEKAQSYIRQSFGWSLLTGLIAIVLLPIVGIFLLVSIFGIPLALFLFTIFGIVVWFGRIFALYSLGRIVMQKSGNKKATFMAYFIGVALYFILSLIPIINFLTEIFVTLSGAGAILAMKKMYYDDLRTKKDFVINSTLSTHYFLIKTTHRGFITGG